MLARNVNDSRAFYPKKHLFLLSENASIFDLCQDLASKIEQLLSIRLANGLGIAVQNLAIREAE